jgi:CBS domain containing-hemolysin-like protein
MLKMTEISEDIEDASSSKAPDMGPKNELQNNNILSRIKSFISPKEKTESSLREAIEEIIEEAEENGDTTSVAAHERTIIGNVLKIKDLAIIDVMIPRADIVSIEVNTTQKELLSLLSEKQFSRLPVYKDNLDNVIGTIHIKDMLAMMAKGKKLIIEDFVREVPIVSPAMSVLDLLLMMKKVRKHMALVVDEFGGIDGLVTIGDVIEAIVGEIDDEYDQDEHPKVFEERNGSIVSDARLDIKEFEEKFNFYFEEEDLDDIDTIGGLVCSIAGRVPARGEIIKHRETGIIFEIIDADPRRLNRIRIRNIPKTEQSD